jgi:hypothetical protein
MTRCSVLAAASFAILLGTTGCKDATPPSQPTSTAVVQPTPAASSAGKDVTPPVVTTILVEEYTAIKIDPNTTKLDFRRLGDQGPGFRLSFPSNRPKACDNGPTTPFDVCDHYECVINPLAANGQVYYKIERDVAPSCPTVRPLPTGPIRDSVVHCGRGC